VIHPGEVIGRHRKGIEIFDEGTITGIDEFSFSIEIGKAQDVGEISLLLNGAEKFSECDLSLSHTDIINGWTITECLFGYKGRVFPPHDDDRFGIGRFNQTGRIHSIIDEGCADDRDAYDIGFLPSNLLLKIPPGIFVKGAIHIFDVQLLPLQIG
jgi:hypothetical protein